LSRFQLRADSGGGPPAKLRGAGLPNFGGLRQLASRRTSLASKNLALKDLSLLEGKLLASALRKATSLQWTSLASKTLASKDLLSLEGPPWPRREAASPRKNPTSLRARLLASRKLGSGKLTSRKLDSRKLDSKETCSPRKATSPRDLPCLEGTLLSSKETTSPRNQGRLVRSRATSLRESLP